MLIDFVPTISGVSLAEAPAFKKAPGGAPANVAVCISKLGGPAAFIGKAFSRDCFVAAGVSFCAALLVCLSPDELGFFIMRGIFNETSIQDSKIDFNAVIRKIPYKGDLVDEICSFSALIRLCLIRRILTAVSRTVLDARYVVSNDGLSKTILYDAILPELC
ncbi:hypothetical protein CASFOL_026373 [Castilleja foliolosa]|uniref:Carbohydrate kinase PfkB domain-containing protein n=1 Tax=Castilleja foliolosa TaxID=1961234 RepID=A0ABD3CH03_9LAMI